LVTAGKDSRGAIVVSRCTIDDAVFGACSVTRGVRGLEARSKAHAMREFAVKVVIAVPRRADITIAANDDVGTERIAGTVGSIGYGTMESTVNIGDLSTGEGK